MTQDLTIPKFGVLSYSSSTSTVSAVQVQPYRRLLLFERVLQYCCCCEGGDCCCMNECYNIVVVVKGGDCCCMNECYNIVVVVKVATAVV